MEEVKNNCFVTQEIVSFSITIWSTKAEGKESLEQFLLQIITVVLLVGEMCTSKKKKRRRREREREKVRLFRRR